MARTKTGAQKKTTSKRARTAHETRVLYGKQNTNGKTAPQKSRVKKMVVEMRGGEPYEYYPLGRFVVVAPQVAGAEPIFKYTRVRVKRAFDMIAKGATIQEVAEKLNNALISTDAVQEALELAQKAFAKAHPSLRKVKRVI